MKRNANQQKDNYLDKIPMINPEFNSQVDNEGKISILIENKGLFNKIAQKFLKKPKISYVHLDDMGNFIYPLIDGSRSVYDIAGLVKEEFGEKAEPLYNRLVTYMRTLESYRFIIMK